jgi:flagella basal body P-ring formation protein FlgA
MKNFRIITLVEIALVLGLSIEARAENCADVIKRQVMSLNHLDSQYYQIDVLSTQLEATDVKPSQVSIKPISQKEPLGLYTVIVTVSKDGIVKESGEVRLKIQKFAEVLVAAGNVERHDKPSPDNFTLQRMDVTSLYEQPVESLEKVARLRLKRNLSKGQILTANALEPVPDIEVGREVSIVCSNGVYTISAAGLSMQSGSAGDYVRVKNKASGKIVVAKVIDESTVAVNP